MNAITIARNLVISALFAYLITVIGYTFIAWDWHLRVLNPGWWPDHYRLFTLVIFIAVFAITPKGR